MKLREEFKDHMHDYHVTENNINYLTADGMIKRNNSAECLNLSEKGFATLAEIDPLGYLMRETKRLKEQAEVRQRLKIDRRIQLVILFISLAALVVAVVALLRSNRNLPEN